MDDLDALLASRADAKPYAYSEGPLAPAERAKYANAPRIETNGSGSPVANGNQTYVSGNEQLDDLLASRASGKDIQAADTQSHPQTQDASPWVDLSRQIGLTVRAGINGLTGIPAMAGDALNAGVNKVFGTHLAPVSSTIQSYENKLGLPQPQNPTERVVQDVAGAMAGISPSVGVGSLLEKSAHPIASAVGNGLRTLPGMQMSGAAGSGAASGAARENDVGLAGQIAASITGGLTGAIAPSAAIATARGVAAIPRNAAGAAQPFTNPEKYVGTQFAQNLGGDAQTIAANIRNAQEHVPGSLPTTAQVGQTPKLVATEKSLANLDPEFKIALAQRDANNNAARWQVLNSVAKTPEELTAAQAVREAAAGPLYDAAHDNTANVGRGFIDFARRPAVQQAMQDADKLARNEGVSLKWPTPDDRAISGRALDYTARALGDMIESAKRSGNSQQARALAEAQDYLKNWTAQYVPGVRDAARVYAENSIPVNTMEAGQQISNTLGTRAMGSDGLPQIQLSPYRTALVQALKSQKYGIEENAAKSLQGVGQDLQRATISNSLRSPGSDTAYNVSANGWLAKQLYGHDFSGAGNAARGVGALGALLTGHPMLGVGILAGGKKLGGMASEKLNAKLAEMLLNPDSLLPYLESANESAQKTNQLLARSLRGDVNQGLIGSTLSPGSQK
jgi:hypothetical protein